MRASTCVQVRAGAGASAGEGVWASADACEDMSANAGAGVSTGESVRTGAGEDADAGNRECGSG